MTDIEALKLAETKMNKSLEATQRELATIRTGRASPAIVEHLKVEYAGAVLPLIQVAGITAPAANMIQVQPWDKNAIGPIEKAILKSDLGLSPTNDGRVIRINIPPLNEERRQELTKLVKKRVEDGKVAVRNERREAQDKIKAMEKEKEISQDEEKQYLSQLQKLTDKYTNLIDQTGVDKEKEITEL